MAKRAPDDEGNENNELIEETGDGGTQDTNQGDTGVGQPDGKPDGPEVADANSSVVAGRDDIPVDPGNSGVVADNVFDTRVDQGGDETQTPTDEPDGGFTRDQASGR